MNKIDAAPPAGRLAPFLSCITAALIASGCVAPQTTDADRAGPDRAEYGVVRIAAASDGAPLCYRAAASGDGSSAAAALCTKAVEGANSSLNRTASLVNRGVIHYNGARYERAATDFGAVIERGTKLARVYVNRGLAYEQMGGRDPMFEDLAKADYERALALQPTNTAAQRRLEQLSKPFLERTPLIRRMIAGRTGENGPYPQAAAAPKSAS